MVDRSYGTIPFYFEDEIPRFLLVFEKWGKGHWNFPKGHRKEGETSRQTALRELEEEVALVVPDEGILNIGPLIHEYSFRHQGCLINRRIEYFLVRVDKDGRIVIQADEILQARWVTLEEALGLVSFTEIRELLLKAHRLVLDKGNA